MSNITFIGVGGCGCNAIQRLIKRRRNDVKYIVVDTDTKTLTDTNFDDILHIGDGLTHDHGADKDRELGRRCAEVDRVRIQKALDGTELLLIVGSGGGGTGSGAMPVIAEIAREMGICVLVLLHTPFLFEGRTRRKNADQAEEEIRNSADAVMIIANDKAVGMVSPTAPITDSFVLLDQPFIELVRTIVECADGTPIDVITSMMRDGGNLYVGDVTCNPLLAANTVMNNALLPEPTEKVNCLLALLTVGNMVSKLAIDEAVNGLKRRVKSSGALRVILDEDDKLEDNVRLSVVCTYSERSN